MKPKGASVRRLLNAVYKSVPAFSASLRESHDPLRLHVKLTPTGQAVVQRGVKNRLQESLKWVKIPNCGVIGPFSLHANSPGKARGIKPQAGTGL